MNLYEITNKFVELNNNEELTEEQYNEIGTELAVLLQEKSCNLIGYIQNKESYISAIKTEIERLKAIADKEKAKIDRFKSYIKDNMERLDLKKIETELGTLSIAKNPISTEIVDEEKIPNEYKTIKQEVNIDKKAILNKFKETGEVVEGVNIIDNKTSLRIK